jgi:hypothetical protein
MMSTSYPRVKERHILPTPCVDKDSGQAYLRVPTDSCQTDQGRCYICTFHHWWRSLRPSWTGTISCEVCQVGRHCPIGHSRTPWPICAASRRNRPTDQGRQRCLAHAKCFVRSLRSHVKSLDLSGGRCISGMCSSGLISISTFSLNPSAIKKILHFIWSMQSTKSTLPQSRSLRQASS